MDKFCSNCGKEIVATSKYCSSCGKELSSLETIKKDVIIYGYQEHFAVNPGVKIYKNNEFVGIVNGGESFNAGFLEKDSLFEFKAAFRSASIMVPADQPYNIQLSFDRLTGQLSAVSSENNYKVQNELKNKDGRNVAITVVIILVLIFIALKGLI